MKQQMTPIEDAVRKLLGKRPHNTPSNFCWNDGYYLKSIQQQYGEQAIDAEIKRLENQL